MTRVLICDDERERSQRMAANLARILADHQGVTVNALTPREFADAIAGLEQRQKKARSNPAAASAKMSTPLSTAKDSDEHPFDAADILFLDYDLVQLTEVDNYAGGSESGERVAYLSRCYSRCGTIVTYNQFFYGRTFDLTLRGHLRSFADLNLSSDSMSNVGLWRDDFEGFRPWSWPLLLDSYTRLQRCADYLAAQPGTPILDLLGLSSGPAYSVFTRELLEFLSAGPPEKADVNEFVHQSGNGLRIRDRLWEPHAAFRIASARISKWLERAVLPGQNILVDAPHLVDRFPSLVQGDSSEASWNRSCALGNRPVSDLGLQATQIEYAEFASHDWLSRRAWIWPLLARNEAIREVRDPWADAQESLAFCEDASRFHRRELVREFVAEMSSEFARRYVRCFPDVTYQPATRFLM